MCIRDSFYGAGFSKRLKGAAANAAAGRSTVFGYFVNDPERFGVVAFDKDGHATSIEEKPAEPKDVYKRQVQTAAPSATTLTLPPPMPPV